MNRVATSAVFLLFPDGFLLCYYAGFLRSRLMLEFNESIKSIMMSIQRRKRKRNQNRNPDFTHTHAHAHPSSIERYMSGPGCAARCALINTITHAVRWYNHTRSAVMREDRPCNDNRDEEGDGGLSVSRKRKRRESVSPLSRLIRRCRNGGNHWSPIGRIQTTSSMERWVSQCRVARLCAI